MLSNKKGQSLIEYLLLVAIMGVASIGVVRVLSSTLNAKFAQVTQALNGKTQKIETDEVSKDLYKKRDLGNFFEKAGE